MITQRRGKSPGGGRGLGLGWVVAFALGYAFRDLQEPDSQVRKLVDAVKERFGECMSECPCCEETKEAPERDETPADED